MPLWIYRVVAYLAGWLAYPTMIGVALWSFFDDYEVVWLGPAAADWRGLHSAVYGEHDKYLTRIIAWELALGWALVRKFEYRLDAPVPPEHR